MKTKKVRSASRLVKPRATMPTTEQPGAVGSLKTEGWLPLAAHKTFEKVAGKREVIWYVFQNGEVSRLKGAKAGKFFEAIPPGEHVRMTSVNATDVEQMQLHDRGVFIQYAYWHDLGIPKSLPPEELVAAYAAAPEDKFRVFVPRPDIMHLRRVLSLRNSIQQAYNDAVRAVLQVGRNMGLPDATQAKKNPLLKSTIEGLDKIRSSVVSPDGNMMDTELANIAKTIPECRVFNEIAKVEGWVTAASVVAYLGGLERFPNVASVWHYAGYHVVDGQAPKRKKGQPVTWSPKLRTSLYSLASSLVKQTGGESKNGTVRKRNPWRDIFEEYRNQEIAVHDEKHPDCGTKDGHCTMRAMRRVIKDILKLFFLACKGEEGGDGHHFVENHTGDAVPELV